MSHKTQYFCLEPSKFRLDGGAMFGIIPKPLWNRYAPADDRNRIDMSVRVFVKKVGEKVILIDTGIGEFRDAKFNDIFDVRSPDTPIHKALRAIDLTPNDVTDLVLSHLHFDHAGGLGEMINGKLEPVFKKARIHLHKDHYHYSLNPTDRDSGSFHVHEYDQLIEFYQKNNQIHWLEGQEGTILDAHLGDLKFICSHGHTPHLVHAYDEKFIYLADLVPMTPHIPIPWVMGYDMAPGVSTENKKSLYKFIMDKNLTCIFEHDPTFWGGKIGKNAKQQFLLTDKFEIAKNSQGYEVRMP